MIEVGPGRSIRGEQSRWVGCKPAPGAPELHAPRGGENVRPSADSWWLGLRVAGAWLWGGEL